MSLWEFEREQWSCGAEYVCGVDEAGAGPLAGPVYAAAVILPREIEISGLNDSKKLTEKKREMLFPVICEQAVAYSIARVEAAEIDEMDILNARMLAMQRAIDETNRRREIQMAYNKEHGITPKTIVKAVGGVIAAVTAEEEMAPAQNVAAVLSKLENEMRIAAEELRFEDAAKIRDRIKRLRKEVQ